MPDTVGNLFTSDDLEDIARSLQVDLGSDDQDVFQCKVTAMQRLLRHGMSKFNKEKLYQHLCIIARRVSVQARNRTLTSSRQAILRSASHLREVVQDLHGKDKFNGLLESERQAIRYFQHFFVDIDHLKEFKETYDREVHTVLYYSYYQPPKSKGDEDSGNYSLSELDEKHEQAKRLKVPKGGNSPRQGTSSRGDNSPRSKKDENLNHVGFSFSKHLDGSEGEKLDVTVQELSEVSERWDRLLHAEEQDLEDYDLESYYEVMECSEHVKFEAVFRLIPDIFAKCYKVIELTKQWWSLAHIIYKTLPLGRPVSRAWPRRKVESHRRGKEEEYHPQQEQPGAELEENPERVRSNSERNDTGSTRHRSEKEDEHRHSLEREDEGVCIDVPETKQVILVPEPRQQQKEDRIKSIKAQLFDLSYAISALDEELSDYKVNLRQLDSRERRFHMLEILQGKVDANLEELQEKTRKLRAQRKVTAQKYSYTFRGTAKYFDYREKLRRIDKKLMMYDQEIQMLVYRQGVVAQDFMLEMEIRPNFIRSYDDLRGNIMETEYRLKERQQVKQGLVEELELLEPDGIARRSRKSENGSVSGQSEISGLSAGTGSSGLRTQTIAEVSGQSQFGAFRESAGSSGSRSTHQTTADVHVQPEIYSSSRANHQNQNVSDKSDVKCASRNSEDSEFQEVFSGLGRRYELVSSAPPVKTQLREKKKREETSRIPIPLPPRCESPHRSVTTIDGTKLGFQDKAKFHSPRPPAAGKRKIRKYVPGRRPIKPVA